jgi:glyoxylase-like metal-dependent hydrolase (beta-lactamase superfamily II)
LVVGDALINLAPHGLMPLPDKYCTDPAKLKTSLRRLLDLPIRRIFFAHGDPILQDGTGRIHQLFP